MTEVLSSKHYRNDPQEIDFSPRQSMAVNVDSDEFLGSPCSPITMNSPLVSPPAEELSDSDSIGDSFRQGGHRNSAQNEREQVELSVITLLLAAFKRTGLTCQSPRDDSKMDIGWPTNVRHVTHVTFDRFNGFLGLPLEFELEIPRRVPSASARVFGVSAESMQCSYDGKGNSVPTILLLLQERLYDQRGLQAEGVFRINAENSQEEHLREQLNKGIVPNDIDVHCLAGLIKAWFRELPRGVLDSLSPQQVMQCHTEEQCLELVGTLPPTQGALLNWAINLMSDVVQEQQFNKMNARNIAMVFAPNMTQMSDPLTALMHAVQVMNLLKTLILKTLADREKAVLDPRPASPCTDPPNGSGHDDPTGEPRLSIFGPTYAIQKDGFFFQNLNERQGIEEYEPVCNSDEMSIREPTDEDELSTDSRGPFSNGSSTMDNTDEDSNGIDSDAHKAVNGNTTINGSNLYVGRIKASPSCNNKIEYVAKTLKERERSKLDGEEFNIKDFVQCGVLESLPSKGKTKGGGVGGKVDKQSGRMAAW